VLHSGMVLSAVGMVLPETFKAVQASGVIKNMSRQDYSSISHASSHMVAQLNESQPMQALSKSGQWVAPGSLLQVTMTNQNKG
jgi:hypothetical protein